MEGDTLNYTTGSGYKFYSVLFNKLNSQIT
jgi:hypothetical protein